MAEQEQPFTDEELREMPQDDLRRLAEEARRGQGFEAVEPDEGHDHGYDLPPPPDPDGLETAECEYLFVTYYDRDAGAIAVAKVDRAVIIDREENPIRLVPRREATSDDIWRGSAEVVKDVESSQFASQTANAMLQVSQAMQQQLAVQRQQEQAAAKEAQRLAEATRKRR